MVASVKIKTTDLICIQETWIDPNNEKHYDFQISGFNSHFNSVGRGKGIATYFNDEYSLQEDVKNSKYQLTKIASEEKDIINVYRSSNASATFLDDLINLINVDRSTHIVGERGVGGKAD